MPTSGVARRCLHAGVWLTVVHVAFGCSWDYPVWTKSKDSQTPLFRIVVGGKAGYIDRNGTVIIPPQFTAFGNHGGDFFEGLARVSASDGKTYYIDAKGMKVARVFASDFSEGLARTGTGNRLGYADKRGKTVIPPQFEFAQEFRQGRAAVMVPGGRWGYIDRSGKFVIPRKFAWAGNFKDGIARVVEEGPCGQIGYGPCDYPINPPQVVPEGTTQPVAAVPRCKYTFIDIEGKVVLRSGFIDAKDFAEGLAPVGDGKRWGYIDRSGALRIALQFDDAEPFAEGLSRVRQGTRWGFIDQRGKFVIAPSFRVAESFSEGLALVGDGEYKYWFIDKGGKRAVPGEFTSASGFIMGLAHVRIGVDYNTARWAYIERTGRAVFTYSDRAE